MSILNVQDVNVIYRNNEKSIHAVDSVSLSLEKGHSLGIVGESGSGKTTLAMAMLRLLDPASAKVTGQAIFNDQDILAMDDNAFSKLRWKEISVVFQKSMNSLSPIHRIGDQFESVYRVHQPHAKKEEIQAIVHELFGLVNLGDRVYTAYPHEMSGGMLQRISIALSLLFRPALIVLDEATTALDVVTQGQILREIKRLAREIEMTRIMITHDMSVVATVCDQVGVMYAGRMMELGDVREVIKTPAHPYTKALVQAYPHLKAPKEDLKIIPGALPDLSQQVPGCIFAPRCGKCQENCLSHRPVRQQLGSRTVYCHYPEVNV